LEYHKPMPIFCVNCGAQLVQDAQFCTSCNAPIGIAPAGTPEIGSHYQAAVARVAAEASWSVPPFILAGAVQVYWLLQGIWGMLSGTFVLGVGLGILGSSGAMRSGFPLGGSEGERILASIALSFLAGAFDVCVSIALVYGLLTLKKWAYRVFMIWLPVKVVLWILAFLLSLSAKLATTESQPTVVTLIVVLGVVLQAGALLAGFMLVRSGKSALDRV
jgi:hypothetical protein